MEMQGGLPTGVLVVYLAFVVLMIASGWKVFTKANQPGWAVIIPFFNLYIMLKMVGRPGWWMILFFIPLINFIIAIMLCFDLAKAFGKGAGFGLGLLFLGFIFYPVLAFGKAIYVGPPARGGGAPAPAAA
jgi:hypothetical protein